MSAARQQPSPQPLEGRRFSFYPAIIGIGHNEWTLERETWSELLVANFASGERVWIPRGYWGAVSKTESPVLIVGLNQELEYAAAGVRPFRSGVITMPRTPASSRDEPRGELRKPRARNLGFGPESRLGPLIIGFLAVGLLACVLLITYASGGGRNPFAGLFRASHETTDQRYLSLMPTDDYHSIVSRLGKPTEERWISDQARQIQFQVLWYPERSYAVVLMGAGRAGARYIGAIHASSHAILDAAELAGGGSTASLLRTLPDF